MSSEQEKEIESLLERIVAKGTFWGIITKTVQKGEYDPNQFLIECYEEVNAPSIQEIWGNELIDDIIDYNVKYNNKTKIVPPTVFELQNATLIFQYKRIKKLFFNN